MLGIGIGGTAEKAMEIAKEALLDPIDIQELQARGASSRAEELRLELFDKVNKSGIGAQGLGGLDHRAGYQSQRLPHPRGEQASGDHSQLCRYPPRPFHAGRIRPCGLTGAEARRLAGNYP